MKTDKHEIESFKIDQLFIGDSKEDLIKLGKARRLTYPISAISTFNQVDRDVVHLIRLTEEKMIPELLGMRHERMIDELPGYGHNPLLSRR